MFGRWEKGVYLSLLLSLDVISADLKELTSDVQENFEELADPKADKPCLTGTEDCDLQENNAKDGSEEFLMMAQSGENNLECYDVQCNGEGCIYEAIKDAGSAITTCTASGTDVCFVKKEETAAGLSLMAGCGEACTSETKQTTQPVPATTKQQLPTTTTAGHFFPKKRRRRSAGAVNSRECCTTSLCNHDSPCGSLTCGAEPQSFKTLISFLLLMFIYLLYLK